MGGKREGGTAFAETAVFPLRSLDAEALAAFCNLGIEVALDGRELSGGKGGLLRHIVA